MTHFHCRLLILCVYRRNATLNVKYCSLLSLTAFPVTGSAPRKTKLYWPGRKINPAGMGRCNSFLAFSAGTVICWRRSEEHTSELQSHSDLVCRLLLEKKKE